MLIKLLAFTVCSFGLVFVSLPSFKRKNSHGIYRFVGWEMLIALIIINIDHWTMDPLIPRQVISWILLLISIYYATASFIVLYLHGAHSEERKDETLLGLEKTTRLVTIRIYKFLRHPMYSSLIFLAWGALLKHITWISLLLAVAATVFFVAGALQEEKENIAYFGEDYRSYMERTKRFVPFII